MVTSSSNASNNQSDEQDAPGFAPDEPTDDRPLGDWRSRYEDPEAKAAIRFESVFVFVLLSFSILAILAIAVQSRFTVLAIPTHSWLALSPFLASFAGGVLGGTLFTMKWLYHSVAKGLWNRDRRLWRIFTPFLSGGAALGIILLCASGALPLFGPQFVQTNVGSLGLSVVFGYFSDRAFSALEQLVEDTLGALNSARKKKKTKQFSRE